MSIQADHKTRFGTVSTRKHSHATELELITRYPHWEFFGTLTFKGDVAPTSRVRFKSAFAFLRESARLGGQDFSRLVWVLRDEQGEKTGRAHFHYLLARSRLALNPSSNFRLMHLWEKRIGGGYSRCAVFNRALAGAEYVTKCLSGEGALEAHAYELDKFGWTERPPILSHSLTSHLSRITRRSGAIGTDRESSAFGEERGRSTTGHPITGTGDGTGRRRPGADKPNEGLFDQTSFFHRLGRHPYGPDRKGHHS
jgi:hypothetical protein